MLKKIYKDPILLQILEESPTLIGIYEGPELRFVFVNKSGAKALRKTVDEILGLPYSEVLPHAKERLASVRKVFQTGESFAQNEMPLPIGLDDQGKPIIEFVNFLSQAVRDLEGKIIGVATFATVVTESVEAKKRLSEQSHRTLAILNHLSTGFFSLDQNWIFTYSNPAATSALGFPPEEIVGKCIWDIHPQLINTDFYHAYHRSMNERVVVEMSSYYPEQKRWYQTTSYPLDEGIAVSFTDITVRKQAEEAKAFSDERFHTLTEAMPQMVWITDSKGMPNYFNSRWFEQTGTTFEQNKDLGWINVIHPDDRERTSEAWKKALNTHSYEVEYRVRMKDNQYRWHIARGLASIDEDNRVKQWYGSTTDIHEQKKTQAELEKAVSARDEFLSIASHELKTPMTVIRLQNQLANKIIERSPDVSDKRKLEKITGVIDRNISRLSRLVDDMLDISRIDHGKLTIELEESNLKDLMDDLVARMVPFFKDANCELEYKSGEDVFVMIDKFRIEQVLVNLFTNAARYGNGKPIQVNFEKAQDKVIIRVKDQGPGIAKEDQKRIFERFERAVDMSEVTGLGLGLFIVKNIVGLHHGEVKVISEQKQGAEFVVELPLVNSSSE